MKARCLRSCATAPPCRSSRRGMAIRSCPAASYVLPRNAIITIQAGRLPLRDQAPGLPRERHPIDVFLASLADRPARMGGGRGAVRQRQRRHARAQGDPPGRRPHHGAGRDRRAAGPRRDAGQRRRRRRRAGDHPRGGHARQAHRFMATLGRSGPSVDAGPAEDADAAIAEAHGEIAAILRETVGHDFSGYKDKTFFRRVQRRIQVLRLPDIGAYLAVLRTGSAGSAQPLQRPADRRHRLLPRPGGVRQPGRARHPRPVQGPRAGRDRAHLGAGLRDRRGSLFASRSSCANGCRRIPAARAAQIFATDIDEAALAVARRGHYPAPLVDDVSAEAARPLLRQGRGELTTSRRNCATSASSRRRA